MPADAIADPLDAALGWRDAGTGAALATVIQTWGSAPRPVGSQLAISQDAALVGSVSGGCVEGAVVAEALDAMGDGRHRVLEYGVSDDEAFAVGLACGGTIRILLQPVDDPLAGALRAVRARRDAADAVGLETDVETGAVRLAADLGDRVAGDRSGFEPDGRRFVTLYAPPLRLAVIGGVHVAQALVPMARIAGYAVTVIDPREAFASASRFPGTTLVHDWPDEAMTAFAPDARTAVVLLTHDPKLDDPALRVALASPVFYVGALGSTRTHATRVARAGGRCRARRAGPDRRAHRAGHRRAQPGGDRGRHPGRDDPGAAPGMRFGPVPVAESLGAVLAHSVAAPGGRLRKGAVIDAAARDALLAAGRADVVVARLDPGEVGEDAAAALLADALNGGGLDRRPAFTGRANLHAGAAGIVAVDRAAIDAANAVDPMITVATVPEWQRVAAGAMAATVKIIAYGVDAAALDRACAVARGALRLCPPAIGRADLIVTTLDGAPTKVDAVVDRLDRLGVAYAVRAVAHRTEALAAALAACDAPLRLVLTASATSDVADVGPAALLAAGGRLERFGMPVDPGNLLFLGSMPGATVIGLPGCARSPKLNGADWVMERAICGVPVTGADIAAMGVGGLLTEIPTRPQPRDRLRR